MTKLLTCLHVRDKGRMHKTFPTFWESLLAAWVQTEVNPLLEKGKVLFGENIEGKRVRSMPSRKSILCSTAERRNCDWRK